MMEIYNEQVKDILVSSKDQTSGGLDIRQAPDGSVSVPDLRKIVVNNLQDVMEVFAHGSSNRATATTSLNEHSSRSHLILLVDITTVTGDAAPVKGKLFLVDLAGSERVGKSGVTGAAMKEAQYINKSLSALGDVMEALDQKAKHIPYRNSKLTYLLQDCLGGNSRTMMIVTVCPTESNCDETLFALQFATRVRNINLGAARKNVNTKNLEEAIKILKAELKESKKRRQALDDQLTELRREQKRAAEKMSAQLEVKVRSVDDAKKTTEMHLSQLQKTHQDVLVKLQEEKDAKQQVMTELEQTQKSLKKAQEASRETGKDREKLASLLRVKEKEIESFKSQLSLLQQQKGLEASAKISTRDVSASRRPPVPVFSGNRSGSTGRQSIGGGNGDESLDSSILGDRSMLNDGGDDDASAESKVKSTPNKAVSKLLRPADYKPSPTRTSVETPSGKPPLPSRLARPSISGSSKSALSSSGSGSAGGSSSSSVQSSGTSSSSRLFVASTASSASRSRSKSTEPKPRDSIGGASASHGRDSDAGSVTSSISSSSRASIAQRSKEALQRHQVRAPYQ